MNGRALGLLAFGDGDDHERSFLGGEVLQNELVIAPRCFIEIARIFVIPIKCLPSFMGKRLLAMRAGTVALAFEDAADHFA